jgi:hypothetical protein
MWMWKNFWRRATSAGVGVLGAAGRRKEDEMGLNLVRAGKGRVSALVLASVALSVGATSSAAAAPAGMLGQAPGHRAPIAHGQLPHLTHGSVNTNTSQNWFGYNQGTLERGGTLFHSITGDWAVPAVSQHTKGQAEASSDWIGIGGGCVDAGCLVTDNTLIQTGTEQDVDSSGHRSYSAWWEVIPAPSLTITTMKVAAGDHMHASVGEVAANSDLWNITIKNVTRGKSYTITVPYPSTHLTAEWIEETPLNIGTDVGFASLPNLTNPRFDLATTNGAPAGLKASEEMQLTDSSGTKVIGTPSAPDSDHDGFAACTWATRCPVPAS